MTRLIALKRRALALGLRATWRGGPWPCCLSLELKRSVQGLVGISRRRMLAAGATAATIAALAPFAPAHAEPQETDALARQLMGPFTAKDGKVRLKIKETAESGANEPVGVVVDSPMTPADHVKAIHILAEGNPYPVVASWYLTPRSGRAEVNFRMRLAKTQFIRAYAVTSDGSVWVDRQEVKVTIGGCGG